MKILIAAIGRLKEGGERELVERYVARFDAAGRAIGLGPIAIVEFPESRKPDVTQRKAEEAARLLSATGAAQVRLALDEHGRADTSDAFARRIGTTRDAGVQTLALLIGGPDGHGEDVLRVASSKLSLSAMTLPHGLARVVLTEQLYRAVTILSGHPYHRA